MPEQKRFTFEFKGIGEVISINQLFVPIYQRSYSWESDQIESFWEDLKGSFDKNAAEYFLGTLVLSAEAGGGRLSIIDGQQRLSTALMLLAVIRRI